MKGTGVCTSDLKLLEGLAMPTSTAAHPVAIGIPSLPWQHWKTLAGDGNHIFLQALTQPHSS